MRSRKFLRIIALALLLPIIAGMLFSAGAVDVPKTATFSDGDVDRVYFGGDTVTFNLTGLPFGTPPAGVPAGTPLRVALGIVDNSGTFTPTNVFTAGLTDGTGSGTGYYVEKTLQADGTLSTEVTGTLANNLAMGTLAVKIYVDNMGTWTNVVLGVGYIVLTSDNKPALVGIDSVMTMPAGVTSDPVLGSGAQNAENLRSLNIKFSKSLADGSVGSIAFSSLNLMDSTAQSQLDNLDTGLIMNKVDAPTDGADAQFTMGVDVSASALSFLEETGATVSLTSYTLFDGLTTDSFAAVGAGTVSGLTFNDSTDTVSFTVDHFSNYTVSMTIPEMEYANASGGLAGAKMYDAVTLSGGNIGAVFNMSGKIVYGELSFADNKWLTSVLGTTVSTDTNAAALALDSSGRPHVVFVNSNNDLVYRYDNGTTWTAGTTIDSLNVGAAGSLYCPDISVDGSGYAHISYMDTKGGYEEGQDYYNFADVVYATNTTGSFARTVKLYGDGSYYGTSDTVNYDQPADIQKSALTATSINIGDLVYHKQGNTYSNSYYYRIARSVDALSMTITEGTSSANSQGFYLFAMDSDGTNAYSLYNRSGSLYITSGITEISAATKAFGASTADLFVDNLNSGALYYAAINGSTLLLYQNGTFKESLTLPQALSSTHTKLSTVVSGSTQYVLYTDTAGKLQVVGYKTSEDNDVPVNTSTYPQITIPNASGFTVNASADESALAYYIVIDKNASAPTTAQVKAGVDYPDSVTVRAAGSFAVLPNSAASKTVTGLTAATEYDVYVALEDLEGNIQASPEKLQTITGIPAGTVTVAGVYNRNTNQDETDIQIVFSPAADEAKVSAYRVFVISEADAASFNLAAAEAVVDASRYITVSKASISSGSYTVNLPDGAKTVAGTDVAVNTNYKLFVLSLATGTATINSLTGPTDAIAATNYTGTLGGSDATPEAGQTVTVSVTDMDENHSTTALDTVGVTIISDLDNDGISVTLTETGVNTGIFSGAIVIDPTGSNNDTDHIYAYGGQTVTLRYTDLIKADGSTNVLISATSTIDPTVLTVPSLSMTGKIVSWTDVSYESGYSVQIYNDADAAVGSAITLAANTTSFDLDAQGLGYDGYYVKVKSVGDVTRYTDSAWSSASGTVTIKNKVNMTVKAGNPTEILNNGNTTAFYITISGTGISSSGDTNPDLKAKLGVAISGTVNCTYGGGINDVILSRVNDNEVTAQVYITSTAANTSTASFTATVSVEASGGLNASHEAGSTTAANVTGIDVNDPPPTAAPSAETISGITFNRTSATVIDITVPETTSGVTFKAYTAVTGGTLLGTSAPSAGISCSFSGLTINSDVSTIYITRQLDFNHAESTPRTAITLPTYNVTVSPTGNQTLTTLPAGYSSGSQQTKTFTITNSGTSALSGVSVAISGANAASFTKTDPVSASVAASGRTTFTVKANDSLTAGTYTATVTVSATHMANKTFTITQVVLPVLATPGSVSVTGTTVSWADVANDTGYQIEVYNTTTSHSLGTINAATNATSADLASFQTNQYCTTGSEYEVRVTAVGDMVSYANSSAGTTTTSGLIPTTAAPSAGNITTTRSSDTKVSVAVTGLTAGDVIKVYAASSGGSALGTTTVAVDQTSATVTDVTVTSAPGTFYISLTTAGRAESSRTSKAYDAYTPSDSGGTLSQTPAVSNEAIKGMTTATTTVSAATNTTTGITAATVASNTVDALLDNAKDAESAGNKAVLEIIVETTANTKMAEVSIPTASFKNIAAETDAAVKIETGLGAVTFDAKAVETIGGVASTGNVKIEIAKVETSALAESAREVVGNRPVYDFSVSAGGSAVSDFGGGAATITIPYTLGIDERPEAVVVYYIDDSGILTAVEGRYNADTGMVEFSAAHFSTYAVGYNELTFTDVSSNAWYEKAVTFIAAREITTGVGNHCFAPDSSLTRAQFIVMMMRAYGVAPDETLSDSFSDAGSTYYTGYLAAAKRLGITNGVGNNMFAPDSAVTRQDMFTLLYRTLDQLGKLPETGTAGILTDYSDADKIPDYAADAMELFVSAGVVSGSNGVLSPSGTSSRAQMAQVMYNLLSK